MVAERADTCKLRLATGEGGLTSARPRDGQKGQEAREWRRLAGREDAREGQKLVGR